jgi:ion channel-forming bestrophin family protein
MLIATNIRLSRIMKNTWKVDIIMLITCVAVYLLHEFLIEHHFDKHDYDIPAIVPTVLGTAIAFFIGFNNNQAYDRWWEARKVWGALVNDSRSWARGILAYTEAGRLDGTQLRELQQRMVRRHIAFICALRAYLRGTGDTHYQTYLAEADLERVDCATNVHNAILMLQSEDLQTLADYGCIDGYRYLQLDAMLVRFTDSMGMSERIRNTVFPTTYNYLTKAFIWLFVIFVELVIAQSMNFWSIPISWMIGFVFVSTQINGMSLVDPFTNNSAAIPLNSISRTIEINMLEMLGEKNLPDPIRPINDEYIL